MHGCCKVSVVSLLVSLLLAAGGGAHHPLSLLGAVDRLGVA